MTTLSDVREAEAFARKQRLDNARAYLAVDATNATADDFALVARLQAVLAGDGADLDKALAHAGVNKLLARVVISFRVPMKARTDD